MEDKLKAAQEKLKGISDYISSVINAKEDKEPVKATNTEPVPVPEANSVPNIIEIQNTNPEPVVVPEANSIPHNHKTVVDVDNDGIEDQTPEQLGRYINDALDDIKKIFRW